MHTKAAGGVSNGEVRTEQHNPVLLGILQPIHQQVRAVVIEEPEAWHPKK